MKAVGNTWTKKLKKASWGDFRNEQHLVFSFVIAFGFASICQYRAWWCKWLFSTNGFVFLFCANNEANRASS